MVGHPRCVFMNYIWLNQLSNTTNMWWIDVYYLVITYIELLVFLISRLCVWSVLLFSGWNPLNNGNGM
jgi:hypothetical protein